MKNAKVMVQAVCPECSYPNTVLETDGVKQHVKEAHVISCAGCSEDLAVSRVAVKGAEMPVPDAAD